jgi:uncharacterized protein YjcR
MNTQLTPPPPKRRRGGQPGNSNALTHGFYSAHFHKADLAALETNQFSGLNDEIALLRLYIRRVVELGAGLDDLTESLNLLRALCQAAAALTRLVKTQRLLSSGQDEFSLAIDQALKEINESLNATGDFPPPGS